MTSAVGIDQVVSGVLSKRYLGVWDGTVFGWDGELAISVDGLRPQRQARCRAKPVSILGADGWGQVASAFAVGQVASAVP